MRAMRNLPVVPFCRRLQDLPCAAVAALGEAGAL